MRVLHLSSERTWRGGEQQIAYLINESIKSGVEIFVACRRGSAFETYCKNNNIDHLALPFLNEFDLGTSYEIKNLCKYMGMDLLHVHSSHSHALAVWSHIIGNKTPIILHRRVDFPVKKNFLSLYKYNHPAIRKIICVSDKIKEVVSESLKQPRKCVTIYSGIDLSKFVYTGEAGKLKREFGLADNTKLIGNISAIAPHKDYKTFVDTAEIICNQKKNIIFLIIGDGPSGNEIKAYVKDKGLEDKIIFTGFRKDVPEILPELDIFLITSKTEGLGTTILDSFACKVPVVATAGGGIPEIINNEVTGLLAPVGKADILAEKINTLLENTFLKEKIRSEAFLEVQKFSKEKTAEKTLLLYEEVTKKVPNDRDFK